MSVVRTVLGDIAADLLGVTDSHDHLFFRSHLLPGHELDDADLAAAEVRAFAAAGGSSIVQWTPRGLGRQRQRLVDISGATGVHIVSATGRHRAEHYHPPCHSTRLTSSPPASSATCSQMSPPAA